MIVSDLISKEAFSPLAIMLSLRVERAIMSSPMKPPKVKMPDGASGS